MPETTVSWTFLELSEIRLRFPKLENRSRTAAEQGASNEEAYSELTTGCQESREVTFHGHPRCRLHSQVVAPVCFEFAVSSVSSLEALCPVFSEFANEETV